MHTVNTLLACWQSRASRYRHFPPRLKQCGCCACSCSGVWTHACPEYSHKIVCLTERWFCSVHSVNGGLCQGKVTIPETGRQLAALFPDSLWAVFESALMITPRKLELDNSNMQSLGNVVWRKCLASNFPALARYSTSTHMKTHTYTERKPHCCPGPPFIAFYCHLVLLCLCCTCIWNLWLIYYICLLFTSPIQFKLWWPSDFNKWKRKKNHSTAKSFMDRG